MPGNVRNLFRILGDSLMVAEIGVLRETDFPPYFLDEEDARPITIGSHWFSLDWGMQSSSNLRSLIKELHLTPKYQVGQPGQNPDRQPGIHISQMLRVHIQQPDQNTGEKPDSQPIDSHRYPTSSFFRGAAPLLLDLPLVLPSFYDWPLVRSL